MSRGASAYEACSHAQAAAFIGWGDLLRNTYAVLEYRYQKLLLSKEDKVIMTHFECSSTEILASLGFYMFRNQTQLNLYSSAREPEETDYMTALQSEIYVLEEAIVSQQITIKNQLEEVQHFEQALLIIQKFTKVNKNPTTSPVPYFKQLIEAQKTLLAAHAKKDMLPEARPEEVTLLEARLQEARLRRSLAVAKLNLQHEQSHLTLLQQELAKKQTDLDWELNYKHLALKYLSGYEKQSHPTAKSQKLLESLELQIVQCQQEILYWQQQLKKPSSSLPAMAIRLKQLQQARDKRQVHAMLLNTAPLQDEGFRQYVRHRVAIDDAVSDFIQAQSDYQKALDKFRAIALHHEQALDFRLSRLENPPQVAITDGRIILRSD